VVSHKIKVVDSVKDLLDLVEVIKANRRMYPNASCPKTKIHLRVTYEEILQGYHAVKLARVQPFVQVIKLTLPLHREVVRSSKEESWSSEDDEEKEEGGEDCEQEWSEVLWRADTVKFLQNATSDGLLKNLALLEVGRYFSDSWGDKLKMQWYKRYRSRAGRST
jgi:hypothetical protein